MTNGQTTSPTRTSFDDKVEAARRQNSFGSDYSLKDKDDSQPITNQSWFKRSRSPIEATPKPNFGTVNVHTHCGRHTDQYLFGGHSIRELFSRKN
ncbi:putative unnamed protein product [Rosellinia necatrix]|uniref:Putative unnamed protein product n=1 Tax=Rosellinia necatrix TaxID=77044 RepID=A0A1W2TEM1_ROSNE|nr:putative unnamed protein product [Rosellinia necatrix]